MVAQLQSGMVARHLDRTNEPALHLLDQHITPLAIGLAHAPDMRTEVPLGNELRECDP